MTTLNDLVEGGKVSGFEKEGNKFKATLADGSEVLSDFVIEYECKNELGEWIKCDMIGCDTPEETFQLAREMNAREYVRNVQVIREDVYQG